MNSNDPADPRTPTASTPPPPPFSRRTDTPRQGRIGSTTRARFRILEFRNEGGSISWRVQGQPRDGRYVRENYADRDRAEARRLELEQEFILGHPPAETPRITSLSEIQLRLAESCFDMLRKAEATDADMPAAIRQWLHTGRRSTTEAPRIDEAVEQFVAWLGSDACPLRLRTRGNLRVRARLFANSIGNVRVDAVTQETIAGYSETRKASLVSRDNDRRALSRFFTWCMDTPRRWIAVNPARVEGRQKRTADAVAPPRVLSIDEAERLLRVAAKFRKGKLLPNTVATLILGLRPSEAARLTWDHINMQDGEIRLEGHMTKTGRSRVVEFNDGPVEQKPFNACAAAWLKACKGRPFTVGKLHKELREMRREAGFKQWHPDIARHTAVSCFVRLVGSYGATGMMFDNSEAVIKTHYQGRVSSEDARRFYSLRPTKA
ncbi:MAG TPA: site-specific integrase [Verrucomicrobiota bacterium]|nr:site-specific integrase [Verrucomicrobiota bacterium]